MRWIPMPFNNVDGQATRLGTSTFCENADDATATLQHQKHRHSFVHDNSHDLIAICAAVTVQEMKSSRCPYPLHTLEEVRSSLPMCT